MPVLFPHSPVTLVEQQSFITDIRRTYTGEYRDAIKDADYKFQASWTVTHAEAARMEGLYRSQPSGAFYIPLWMDASLVTTTISAAQTVISCATDADYRAGGYAAIIQGETSEVCPVTSAAGGTLTLTTGPTATYAGSNWSPVIVAPVVIGYFPSGIERTDRHSVCEMSAQIVCLDPVDLGASSFPTHLGYGVITDETVIYRELPGSITQMLEKVENGFGAFDLIEMENYARHRGSIASLDHTHADRFSRRRFVHWARGRDRPFWVPTWKNDLPLRTQLGAGSTTMRVQRISPVNADHVGKSVQFYLSDGTTIHREITAAASVGGDDTSIDLTISAPGSVVQVTDTVSLMHLCRFDTDEIAITHQMGNTGAISSFNAPVVEVAA